MRFIAVIVMDDRMDDEMGDIISSSFCHASCVAVRCVMLLGDATSTSVRSVMEIADASRVSKSKQAGARRDAQMMMLQLKNEATCCDA